MKRLATVVIALAFIAAGCGSSTSGSSTSPSGTPTKPTFSAALLPSNEVPPITNAESSGTGTATITFDTTTSGGNVTAASVTFVANLTGFPAGTTVILGHIHKAPAGVAGGVVISANVTATPLATGTGTLTLSNASADPAVVQDILNNPSQYYFNLHSTLNPGGFVRGQLSRVQ